MKNIESEKGAGKINLQPFGGRSKNILGSWGPVKILESHKGKFCNIMSVITISNQF